MPAVDVAGQSVSLMLRQADTNCPAKTQQKWGKQSFLQPHQLGGDGEARAVLLGQFHFDGLGVLDRLQGSGQVLRSHLKTNLIVLRGHALHLVLIEEVGLQSNKGSQLMIPGQAGSFSFIWWGRLHWELISTESKKCWKYSVYYCTAMFQSFLKPRCQIFSGFSFLNVSMWRFLFHKW